LVYKAYRGFADEHRSHREGDPAARRFGSWFGAAFDGPFADGARLTGVDYSKEPATLIGFALEPVAGDGGWERRTRLIEKTLALQLHRQ
jgi:hypothetical protein